MRRFRLGWGILILLHGIGAAESLTPSKQLYDRNGLLLHSALSAQHTYYQPVSLAQISPWLIGAVVAVEDKRFYTHPGVDVQALLRAFWQNAQEGKVVSGASTITQQLARAISPRSKTWWGKTKEAAHALRLEQTYTKEEILEQYFNVLEFGNLTQGVQAASQFYFQSDAADLSLSEAAFLAGLLKSPTYYNPVKHFDRALKRRNLVLEKMHQNGFIDQELYQLALEEKIQLRLQPRPFEAPHFARLLLTQTDGPITDVYTTLDLPLQQFVEQTIKNQLALLADHHVTNAAVVVLDNASGEVLAYAGSADFHDKSGGQVDGARALRQPGSALKPFVYGLAFQEGKMTPASLLADEDTFFEGGFRPRNYDETFHGLISAREALACSYNIPAVKAADMVGTSALLDLLRQAGFASLGKPADFYGLGLALGNGEVRLLELANAYALLARGGVFKPVKLARTPEVKLPGHTSPVLTPQTAYLITDILADNHARAAAFGLNSALQVPFEMAAKTGTSKDYKDNFAIGYTPRWTVGVWVGNFDASSMQKVSGVTGAGPILHDVALYLNEKFPSPAFTLTPGVVHQKVCADSGLLAGPSCTHTREEVFDKKHVPARCNGQHIKQIQAVKIVSPVAGDIFYVDPSFPRQSQQVKLEAVCQAPVCHWQIDGKALADTSCQTWWPLAGGKHTVQVTCNAQTEQLSFQVVQ